MKQLFGISKMRFNYRSTLSALVCMAATFGSAYAEVGNPRVNQVGYAPDSPKLALYKTNSLVGLAWQLKQNGTLIASGNTIPLGDVDAASGDNLHRIDFSNYAVTGTGYTLTVGADSSYPFDVSSSLFNGAFYDSLKYFYHNRSGIAIETAYTGGGNTSYATNAKLARPAGHLNQGVNKGDVNVPCWTGTCNYSLNVSKGWYDAGDHGKYVVNGGISVWTLLNMYEVASQISYPAVPTNGFRLIDALGDGKLNIPESANGVPDILDEARWQLEFLLAMQVPAGQAKAGMAHHKVHDVGWTGLPLAPHEDSQQRALVPPTTAATLNLAATAAQCARIWKNIDSVFAGKCLTAAESAWAAAQANPNDIYSGNYDNGGGGYGDAKVTDEFYWAAAELFITTGQDKYLQVVTNHEHSSSDFGWPETEVLGVISLASAASSFTAVQKDIARQRIVGMADLFLTLQNGSGYLSPVTPLEYYWGSNSVLANRLILMGLAYNFTGDKKFANGLMNGVDYLFGRNTLSFSFVTGHGEKSLQQPHHRFWAGVLNNNYPWAPPGALSGGPNTGLEDSVAAAALAGCKPAACFMDDINSWSTNEITINWNAPFAWVLGFYNEYAGANTSTNAPPVVQIIQNGSGFYSGSTVTFDGRDSRDPEGGALTYNWVYQNFYGSEPLTLATGTESGFSITTSRGSNTVSLTVTDDAGNSATKSVTFFTVVDSASSANSSSSSSVRSSVSSVTSSSRGTCTNTAAQCNWYGTLYPICQSTQSGWGWENNKSCISQSTCATAPNGNPIAPPPSCPPSSSSVSSSSSSSAPNTAPVAVISGGANWPPCCTINLSALNSTDADGDTLTYYWKVEHCGSFFSSCGTSSSSGAGLTTGPTLKFNVSSDFKYRVTLTVNDGRGGEHSVTQTYAYIVETSSAATTSSSSVRSSSSSSISSSVSSITSSRSSSSSSIAAANCQYVISNQWNNGFTGVIRIKNNGTSAINTWNVAWSYTDGSKITNSWNANVTGTNPYSASNLDWNKTIQPGQAVEFGFQGTKSNSSAQVPVITGSVCQ